MPYIDRQYFEEVLPRLVSDTSNPVVIVNTRSQSIVARSLYTVADGYVVLNGFLNDQSAGSFTPLTTGLGGTGVSYTIPYGEITGVHVSGTTEALGKQVGFQGSA